MTQPEGPSLAEKSYTRLLDHAVTAVYPTFDVIDKAMRMRRALVDAALPAQCLQMEELDDDALTALCAQAAESERFMFDNMEYQQIANHVLVTAQELHQALNGHVNGSSVAS